MLQPVETTGQGNKEKLENVSLVSDSEVRKALCKDSLYIGILFLDLSVLTSYLQSLRAGAAFHNNLPKFDATKRHMWWAWPKSHESMEVGGKRLLTSGWSLEEASGSRWFVSLVSKQDGTGWTFFTHSFLNLPSFQRKQDPPWGAPCFGFPENSASTLNIRASWFSSIQCRYNIESEIVCWRNNRIPSTIK